MAWAAGTNPSGFHPGAGTRTIADPTSMKNGIDEAKDHEGLRRPRHASAVENRLMSQTESGEAIIAPPPKPMIAMPVAIPGRSGNHLIKVDTGEM